jgi:hypothetical protein
MDDDDVVTLCGIMMIIRNIIFNRKHVQGLVRDIIFRIGKQRGTTHRAFGYNMVFMNYIENKLRRVC